MGRVSYVFNLNQEGVKAGRQVWRNLVSGGNGIIVLDKYEHFDRRTSQVPDEPKQDDSCVFTYFQDMGKIEVKYPNTLIVSSNTTGGGKATKDRLLEICAEKALTLELIQDK